MPLLRSPWSTPSSSASDHSASSRSSSVNSHRSSSSNTHNSTPNARTISAPMAKRAHIVEVPFDQPGRPNSQCASLLLMGKEGKRESTKTSGRSSRRTSDGQGPREEDGGAFQQRVRVVVTEPAEEGEGQFVGRSPPKKGKKRESTSGLSSRQKRFSLFTMDTVRELEKAEEGAVLVWMQQLSDPRDGAIPEAAGEEEGDEGDVFGPVDVRASGHPSSLGRSLSPSTAMLGASLSAPSLPASAGSNSTFTPRASSPHPNAHLVRFAASSDPPPSTSNVTFPHAPTPSASAPSSPSHSRTPSATLDHLEYEFVSRTTPRIYENPHSGQGYAPPVEPRGRMAKLVRPHPVVRARKNFRERRSGKVPVPVPAALTPSSQARSARSSERSASRGAKRSDEGGGMSRKGKEREVVA
ncbi:hypothetical protein JCM6882_008819 [Rhodosporidiobolus microsporus]